MKSKLITGLSIVLLTTACQTAPGQPDQGREIAYQLGIENNQGEITSKARWNSAQIHIRWARDVRHAIQLCAEAGPRIKKALASCAWGTSEGCNVVAVQPKDFYDIRALAILGHEVWHCFGATHD